MLLCCRVFLLVCLAVAQVIGGQTYKILVKTGSAIGDGTDGDVYVTLYGTEGESSEQELDTNGDDFERGSIGVYSLATKKTLGDVRCIRVNFKHRALFDEWKLIDISVQGAGVTVTFDYNNWFREDKTVDIFNGDGVCKDNSCDCLRVVRGGGYCSIQSHINLCPWSCYGCRMSTSSTKTTMSTTTISTTTTPVTTRGSTSQRVRTSHVPGPTATASVTSQSMIYTEISSLSNTTNTASVTTLLYGTTSEISVVNTSQAMLHVNQVNKQLRDNTGTTAGIAVGGVLVLVIVVGAVVLVVCIRKRRRDSCEQKSYQASFKVTNPGYSNVSESLEITSKNGGPTFPNVSPQTDNNTHMSDLYSTPRKPVINGITNGPLSEKTDLDDLYSKPIKPKRGCNSESRDTSAVSDFNLKPLKPKLRQAGHAHYEEGIENVGYGVAGSPNENVDMVTNDMYGDLDTSGGDIIFADNDLYEAGVNPEDQVYADGDVVEFVSNEIYA